MECKSFHMQSKTSIPIKTTIAVALLTLGGEIAWGVENQFFNVFLYNEISKNTFYISLMVALSAVTATLTAIIFGAFF